MPSPPAGPSYAALRRHNKRIQAMIADPECVGDLLAYGIALARYVDLDASWRKPREGEKRKTYEEFGKEVLAIRNSRQIHYAVRGILRGDIRRYDSRRAVPNGVVCTAPMIRRAGECGQPSSHGNRETLTDLDTGERTEIGSCSNPKHREWLQRVVRRNRDAMKEHPPPVPAANSGGVLARHIPEVDWDKVYVQIDPNWTPPPEEKPWTKPKLALLLGEPDPDDEPHHDRPSLAVVAGAGEGINIDEPREKP